MKQLNFRTIIAIFLSWRILLFLPLILSEKFISVRYGYNFALPMGFMNASKIVSHFLVYPWGNFDGIYYLTIAQSGYTPNLAGFFPLYPLLLSIFDFTDSSYTPNTFLAGIILSSIFLILSLFIFRKLILIDYKEEIVYKSILFLLVFPTSFFFASIYSESLFFLLLVVSFFFARKSNWILSSIFGILLAATRIVGIAILPALLLEFYLQNKTFFSNKIILVFLTPLGLVAYSLFNYLNFGNAFQFVKAQGTLLNNRSVDQIVLFPQTVFRYLKILFTVRTITFEWWIALLELSSFIFALVMLYIAWKKKIRFSYLLFSALALLIPASTGTFSAIPRYILVLFPMFITIALIKNRWFKFTYFVVSVILLFVLFMLFSKGYYIS